jgi:hypothetical protein
MLPEYTTQVKRKTGLAVSPSALLPHVSFYSSGGVLNAPGSGTYSSTSSVQADSQMQCIQTETPLLMISGTVVRMRPAIGNSDGFKQPYSFLGFQE